MKWLVACLALAGCAQAGAPNAIIGGLIDAGTRRGDAGDLADPDASLIDAPPNQVTLNQTTSNGIVDGNSFACLFQGSDVSRNNSYYRVFTPSESGVTNALHIAQVEFGIEFSSAAGGMQPATLNIGTYSGTVDATTTTLQLSDVVPVMSANIQIRDTPAPAMMTAPIKADIPAGSNVIVELAVPGGQTFFIGTNTSGEAKPGYTRADDCGITDPTSMEAIASPGDADIVMTLTGTH
ncbi:MAG TPA: hypothetical protein VH165_10545 [Kofleriaceae bacterium]|jgi:hypothetical protein|nr:hypothetical protein [Kofleriaceae bacterium]